METKLKVCHNRPSDAYEIQTDETLVRLVGAVFHGDYGNPFRLTTEEASKYAALFAASPDLLEACKKLTRICNKKFAAAVVQAEDAITLAEPEGA